MRIGVIGSAGKIGQMRVRTILDNPGATLAGTMDMTLAAATSGGHGAPACCDLEKFLALEMEAVVISTPSHVREPLCEAAFARGLHVLSEKPLAHTLDGARRILAMAKASGRVLGAGFNMRYYPAFSFVKDVMESGRLGVIDHIRIYGGHEGLPKFAQDWEYKAELSGGGALWDVGIHMTDMARHLLGEITSVYGVSTNKVWNVPGSEDNAMAIFKAPSGVSAIYQATWDDWKGYRSEVEVYGTLGMVSGAYAPMRNTLITMEKTGGATTITRNFYPQIMLREKVRSWKPTALNSFALELEEFMGLVRGKPGLRIADGHAALRAIEVAAALGESAETGLAVSLENIGDM